MNWINEIVSFLLVLLATVLVAWSSSSSGKFFQTLYKWVPPILLLYVVPALATNIGIVQPGSNMRLLAMNTLLPLSLIMLTAIIHIPDLLRLTRKGMLVFLIGTIGIVIGGPLALQMAGMFDANLLVAAGSDAPWRGLVCITGSWINGTPGQLSMKEVYGASEELFLTSLATDVILQNGWLFFLLYSVRFHKRVSRWLTGRRDAEADMVDHAEMEREQKQERISIPAWRNWLVLLLAYAAVIILAKFCAEYFQGLYGNDETNPWSFLTKRSIWLILFSTTFGVLLSFTGYFKKELLFWTKLGNGLILFIIATIGLQLDLRHVSFNSTFFVIGITWLLIHLGVMVAGARLLRAPWHFIAIGSQANIGGPASASVVASAFHPSLVSLGILLGVMSNLIGNYANLLAGLIFQSITH